MMQKKHLSVIIICLVLGAFFAIVQVGISGGMISGYWTTNLFLMGINIILAASLNLINGFTGEFSLGHAGFMAVGAYAGGVITTNLGLPFPLAIVVGMLAAAVAGVIVGLPTLRLRGDYLAIATLGFGEIVRVVLMNIDYVGGASGLKGIPDVVNWPIIFFSVVLSLLLIKNFIGSSHGRACLAVRENDLAAQMMGVNITYYKVLAFVVGAALAGLAGVLYAHYYTIIQPKEFSFMLTFDVLVMVMVGGLGSLTGSVVGAVLLTTASAFLHAIPELRMVLYALLLIISAVFRPQGLLGEKEVTLRTFQKLGGVFNAASGSKQTD
jgi:branched-chain amino acid transport system permease protein